jgi:choline-sulfatase
MTGPDIPAGAVVETPANLLDLYPFFMECTGETSPETVTGDHPGIDLMQLIAGEGSERAVFSEYHAMGSKTAAYMIRKGPYKLIYYAHYPPQLFDLEEDPEELNDLAEDENAKPILEELTGELFKICDPQAVDAAAKDAQKKLLRESGGRAAVIERGDLGFSVPPGVTPEFD